MGRDKRPCVVLKKALVFVSHGTSPIWVRESNSIGVWERRDARGIDEKVKLTGREMKAGFCTHAHSVGIIWGMNGNNMRW